MSHYASQDQWWGAEGEQVIPQFVHVHRGSPSETVPPTPILAWALGATEQDPHAYDSSLCRSSAGRTKMVSFLVCVQSSGEVASFYVPPPSLGFPIVKWEWGSWAVGQ